MLSTIWNTLLFNPVLNGLIILYHYLGDNLGLAILAIAVIVRLFLTPLVKKQTEMTKKMSGLKPELEKIQKKYANNKEKLSQEQMKLYKRVGYNPLGCVGTMVPQLIILSVLIGVIRAVTESNLDGLYTWVRELVGISNGYVINPDFLFWDLTKSYNGMSAEFGRVAVESLPYIALALLVGVVQYLTTTFTQKMQNLTPETPKKGKDSTAAPDMQAQMQKSMMFMFPLMTIFFTISMPAALGWYWMVQSFMLVVQYFTLDFDKTKKGIQNLRAKYFTKK
ncbi:MAG: YidC/Oxa1 family membrane protein insertase [Candidatus Dojkabacteria bacterium]|jgi:YidC/Oxa1 family membrane protein insertase|nr:YidC/Oxa1 family membrane protein insertase [Candidatus Dojkabacteria bacterium]